MRISRRPMFATIIYGLLAGASFIPMVMVMSSLVTWTAAFRLSIWFILAGYLVVLTRWGRVPLLSLFFPLLLLLFLVFWGETHSAFFFLALGSLLKALVTESALCLGAGALVVFFAPHSTITWGIVVWMFFLVQSIYFVVFADFGEKQEEQVDLDPFHQARTRAERILSAGP
jgi:hypothetical protein